MSWQSAKNRCANPNARNYRYYGGRGIQMCERWKGSFAAFISDMGLPSLGQSLDRIDNNGDYEPDNCRWATQLEQQQNMRKNVLLTLDGRTQCVSAWAREYGMDVNAFYNRLRLGWEMRRALTQPVRAKRRRQRAEAA